MSALATGRKIRTWTNRVKQFSSTLQHAVVEERGKLSRSSLLVHVVVGGHAENTVKRVLLETQILTRHLA
jgi:hypothetical protein